MGPEPGACCAPGRVVPAGARARRSRRTSVPSSCICTATRRRGWPRSGTGCGRPPTAGRGRSREFIAGQQRGTRTEKEPFRESSESHQPETQTPQTGRPPGLAPSARRRTSGRRRTSAEPQSAQRTRGPGGTGFAGSRGFVFGEKANARRPSWALMGPRRPVRRSSAPRGPGENGPGYLNGKAQQHTNE